MFVASNAQFYFSYIKVLNRGQRLRVVEGEYYLEDTSGRQVRALLKG